jgi:hypothetical protein
LRFFGHNFYGGYLFAAVKQCPLVALGHLRTLYIASTMGAKAKGTHLQHFGGYPDFSSHQNHCIIIVAI